MCCSSYFLVEGLMLNVVGGCGVAVAREVAVYPGER